MSPDIADLPPAASSGLGAGGLVSPARCSRSPSRGRREKDLFPARCPHSVLAQKELGCVLSILHL